MAKKKETTTTESTISIEAIRTTKMRVKLIGTSDLILNKKARSFEREEIFKQSHPKGTKIPSNIQQPYNMWEKLITSINWRDPIVYHDEDYSLYTEEEWKDYMENNAPCILGKAFQESFKETFISCGFKDSTGKSGADLKRTVSVSVKNPITFVQAGYDQHLAMTNGLNKVNVLTQQNQFTGWTCDIEIAFLDGTFPKETILTLVQMSGNFIGVGSRRGEGYGRYTIGIVETEGN